MSKNYQHSANKERELVKLLRDNGWVAHRVAGSGGGGGPIRINGELTDIEPSCDVVASKNGITNHFEVKTFDPDNLPVDVSKDSKELAKIREAVYPHPSNFNSFGDGRKGDCYFAIIPKGSANWYIAPYSMKSIKQGPNYDHINTILYP